MLTNDLKYRSLSQPALRAVRNQRKRKWMTGDKRKGKSVASSQEGEKKTGKRGRSRGRMTGLARAPNRLFAITVSCIIIAISIFRGKLLFPPLIFPPALCSSSHPLSPYPYFLSHGTFLFSPAAAACVEAPLILRRPKLKCAESI